MIGLPVNDHDCLAQITELVVGLARQGDAAIVELAERFDTTAVLAAWIRSLPQRDDSGDPADGPKADACDPPQRLRIPAPDPNCVERAALYLAIAELIDPHPLRQLATINTPVGRHTFLIEDGDPVVLDPSVPRNALEAGLFLMEERPVEMTPEQQIDWLAAIAEEPAARYRDGTRRVRNARDAMHRLISGAPLSRRAVPDVAFTLVVAEREARLFGVRGLAVHRGVMSAIEAGQLAAAARPTRRNRRGAALGDARVRPIGVGTLASIARAAGRIGVRAGAVAAQTALAKVGVGPALLAEVERELNREGLSLGPLAAASEDRPMFGSLAAVVAGGAP